MLCASCNKRFCFRCNKPLHYPVSCRLLEIWNVKCKDESETANWILAHTKSCPKCKVRIEKNKGCNHMTCEKCHYHFCWVCMGDWKEHGQDYYNCNKFKESKDNKNDEKAKAKVELDRYLHYFKRFQAHNDSLRYAETQLNQARQRMEEIQEIKGAGWVEVQFLGDAVSQLIENRAMLKYSYSLAFYLPSSPGKTLFEENQSMLERYTEILSELTEKNFDEIDKTNVSNQSLITKKFMSKIIQAVQQEELNELALEEYTKQLKELRS